MAEALRVLKPLAVSRCSNWLTRSTGMRVARPFHGWLWHSEPRSYGYLAESIARFVTGPELVRTMDFAEVENRSRLIGAVSLVLSAPKPVCNGKRVDCVA